MSDDAADSSLSDAKADRNCHIALMDEDNLEIVVTPGNWQIPGRPQRWNWQVRQKEPSKLLVKGVTMGVKHDAHDAAQAAKVKLLARG
jgi:hypothetical protein